MSDLPAEVAAVARWLEGEHGSPVSVAEPVVVRTEGFDSAIFLVRFAGDALPTRWQRPLVLRVKSDAGRGEEVLREAAVQEWVAERGYPAPRVLATFAAGEVLDLPAQVMERVEGKVMLDAVKGAPWRTRSLIKVLAGLHAQLHQLPPEGFPLDGADLLDRRLALAERMVSLETDAALARALEQVRALAPRLRDAPVSVCHGDFHPLNVVVSGSSAGVIDWTDAGLGDRQGDVARTIVLFDVAAVAATNAAERVVLETMGPRLGRGYRRAYEEHLSLDGVRIALWRPVHLLHGWAQAIEVTAADDGRAARIGPDLAAQLRVMFESAIAACTS